MNLTNFKPEWVALGMNICIFLAYLFHWKEPYKIIYWLGACLLAAGLVGMRG